MAGRGGVAGTASPTFAARRPGGLATEGLFHYARSPECGEASA